MLCGFGLKKKPKIMWNAIYIYDFMNIRTCIG